MNIVFKTIRYKNFLSTGSGFNEIKLNSSHSTLLIGKNGEGKCLDKTTTLNIRFVNKMTRRIFLKATTDISADKISNTTIETVYEFYRVYPELIEDILIETRFGYFPIEAVGVTAFNSRVLELKTIDDQIILTSPDHLMLSSGVWTKSKDLKIGDHLLNKAGATPISSIRVLPDNRDLYDIQVAEVHEFYANGLVSHNSTMLDAVCFALFSKPFRNVSKPQLINSINGKQCLTEIEFDIGEKQYKIVRGMKPNIFEIWCSGTLLNQDAANKDYQKVLEQQILRLNYKTFTQVVILGTASFVPFMQLPAHQRREVIEDILDIRIFSIMNQLLKEHLQSTKDSVIAIENAVSLAKEKVMSQKRLISSIASARESTIEKLESKINETLLEVEAAQSKQDAIQDEIKALSLISSKEPEVKSDLRKVSTAKSKIDTKCSALEDRISFMEDRDDCPSCQQSIPHEHKLSTISTIRDELTCFDSERDALDVTIAELTNKLDKIIENNSKLTQKNIELGSYNTSITMLNKQISKLNEEIQEHKHDTGDLDAEKTKLKTLASSAMNMLESKNKLIEEKNLQDIAGLLLKDSGIKTAIIREYLPIMNKLINKYLNIMDSYIHFELDENFNESIKSRFRDDFTFSSFSEGEKTRINLAILFAWRQIAKMKNSVNTNLLIFDEVMDGSLDSSGTDTFVNLLKEFSDSNIFVISHKTEALLDKFGTVLQVEKKNDFSTISEI